MTKAPGSFRPDLLFYEACKQVFRDGRVDPEENELLVRLATSLGISRGDATALVARAKRRLAEKGKPPSTGAATAHSILELAKALLRRSGAGPEGEALLERLHRDLGVEPREDGGGSPPDPEPEEPPQAPPPPSPFADLEARVEAGDAAAAEELALHLELGTRVPRDLDRARSLYSRAAQKGSPSAQANLGGLCLRGEGGPVDLAMARFWCEKAAARSLTAREHLAELDRLDPQPSQPGAPRASAPPARVVPARSRPSAPASEEREMGWLAQMIHGYLESVPDNGHQRLRIAAGMAPLTRREGLQRTFLLMLLLPAVLLVVFLLGAIGVI